MLVSVGREGVRARMAGDRGIGLKAFLRFLPWDGLMVHSNEALWDDGLMVHSDEAS